MGNPRTPFTHEQLQTLLQTAPQALLVVDGDGRIVHANGAAERLFGYEVDELVEQPLEPLLPGSAEGALLVTGRRRDGSRFPAELRRAEWEGAGARLVTIAVADLVEAHRIEALRQTEARTLRDSNTRLRRSNDELQMFAYVASHDLQEPLRMVSSFVALLEKRYRGRLDEDADKYIRYAVDGAQRMQALINDLLAYARVESRGRLPAPTDSGEVLARVLEDMKAMLDETGARVSVERLPTVLVDRGQLAQLFQNLIANALKFHKPGSPPSIAVWALPDGDEWQFSVRDEGIGIAPRHFARIFAMFQRLHGREEYPGTGIGLALCKKIVERHGGRIWVDSAPGEGATFRFTLPAPGATE